MTTGGADMSEDVIRFFYQPRQKLFTECKADICIYGGSAGGGKTRAVLQHPCHGKTVTHYMSHSEIILQHGP